MEITLRIFIFVALFLSVLPLVAPIELGMDAIDYSEEFNLDEDRDP